MSTGHSVLIIRPYLAAQRTAALVAARGFVPFVIPLSATLPLSTLFPDKHYDALIATSENAFLKGFPQSAAYLTALPLYCVGERTASAAREKGFNIIAAVEKDIDALCTILDGKTKLHFLYLAGKQRRSMLEKHLQQVGAIIDVIELYETELVEASWQQQNALPEVINNVLLYSASSIQLLSSLANIITADTRILCLSLRIAKTLPEGFVGDIQVVAEPTEKSLLSQLFYGVKNRK
ncbi:MAG: uroporphyrinogen-III synthase [Candidatus Tokpelaia sp. JSC188]|nr:MAG: uroporphyrinogen-III synthase [Candidatus Tokpelaia sp. JSC188]